MFSTAILRKPSATSSGVRARRRSRRPALRTCLARSAASSGWSLAVGRRSSERSPAISLPDHHIGVGDGERARRGDSTAGPGLAPAESGPTRKRRAVEMQDRAAAGRDRVDAHHRRAHAHAGDLGLEGALVSRRRNARRRSRCRPCRSRSRVSKPASARRLGSADHAAGRAGQDGVLALEQRRRAVRPPEDIMNISARAGARACRARSATCST